MACWRRTLTRPSLPSCEPCSFEPAVNGTLRGGKRWRDVCPRAISRRAEDGGGGRPEHHDPLADLGFSVKHAARASSIGNGVLDVGM
jgi:hypothetical protein